MDTASPTRANECSHLPVRRGTILRWQDFPDGGDEAKGGVERGDIRLFHSISMKSYPLDLMPACSEDTQLRICPCWLNFGS
jgi:hypothetical protein